MATNRENANMVELGKDQIIYNTMYRMSNNL